MCIESSLHSKVFTSNLSQESWYKIPASQSWCSWKQIIIRLAVCTLLWSIHNKPIHILDRFHKNTSHLKCYIPHLRLTLWEQKLLCFSSHHIRLSGRFSTICVASSKMKCFFGPMTNHGQNILRLPSNRFLGNGSKIVVLSIIWIK